MESAQLWQLRNVLGQISKMNLGGGFGSRRSAVKWTSIENYNHAEPRHCLLDQCNLVLSIKLFKIDQPLMTIVACYMSLMQRASTGHIDSESRSKQAQSPGARHFVWHSALALDLVACELNKTAGDTRKQLDILFQTVLSCLLLFQCIVSNLA